MIWARGRRVRALARGAPANNRTNIYLDLSSRNRLRVRLGEQIEFTIEKGDFMDELLWAWSATDAMPRIAARLGVLSLGLGLIGLFLGIASLA